VVSWDRILNDPNGLAVGTKDLRPPNHAHASPLVATEMAFPQSAGNMREALEEAERLEILVGPEGRLCASD
jgi:hypothetical protein